VYEERVGALSKEDFALSVGFAPDQPAAPATAHLRGKGSLGCARKSYTLDLAGSRPRHWLAGDSATDHFYLLSMCLDDRYVQGTTGLLLMQQLGLFPLEHRMIELAIDGATRGVYVLVEKPSQEIERDHGGVRAVLRRRFEAPPATSIEVKMARDDAAAAAAAYQAWLGELASLSGADLAAVLAERMDLAAYLRLLALSSLLRNGDTVDELWLWSTDRIGADGVVGDFYSFMGWDPEDLFTGCHYEGQYAFPDPWGLAYCAEAELDTIILSDPHLYARYVDALDAVLAVVTEEVFAAATAKTAAALLAVLARADVAAAMVELIDAVPAAADPVVAEAEVRARLARMETSFHNRRAALVQSIAAYRAAVGAP
jgi:hypothetical protein